MNIKRKERVGEWIMNRPAHILLVSFFIVALSVFSLPAYTSETKNSADSQLSVESLLELLVEKGVINSDDAASIKQKAAEKEKKQKAEAKQASPTFPSIGYKVRLESRFSSVERDTGQPSWGGRDDKSGGDGFALRRARFYMTGKFNPEVSYTAVFSSDWGASNTNLHLASMEWKGWKSADLTAGILTVPFGWEIQANDAIFLQTDCTAMSSLIPPDKDMGIRLDSKRPFLGGFHYQFMIGNGSGRYVSNPNRRYLVAARIYNQVSSDLSIGLSGSRNPNTDVSSYQTRFLKANASGSADPYGLLSAYSAREVDEDMWGLDFQWHRNHDTLRGEYMRMKVEPSNSENQLNAKGCYLSYSRGFDIADVKDRLEFVAGIQEFDPNTFVKDKYDLTSYVLGLNYHLCTSKRYGLKAGEMSCQNMIRLNYIWNNESKDSVDNNKFVLQHQTWF